jgi:hypothetical protein
MKSSAILNYAKSMVMSDREQIGTIRLGVFRGVKTLAVPKESVQIRLGLWERETYKYIRRAAREANWVIDIGAGSGELSIFFETRTKADPIIAVEAWDTRLLLQNIAINQSGRIEILEQYLGTEVGRLPLNSVKVPRNRRGFIKLDADFAEYSILQSGQQLLEESKSLLLVETHSAVLERDCCEFLRKLGYHTRIIPNAWWRSIIPEQRPSDHNRWFWAEPN